MDSSSTHNFIDHALVKKIGYQTHIVLGVNIIVVNGDKVWTQKGCTGINWEAQGIHYSTDFLVLTLMGCDLVL